MSNAEGGYRLALFIDGLDEFSEDHVKLLGLIKELNSWETVKICVSSRPWNVFHDAFEQTPSLAVHDLTKADIGLYLEGCFGSLPAFKELQAVEPDQATRLLDGIAAKANGVFLWVAVVVRTLAEQLEEGAKIANLQQTLGRLPRGVSELFSAIWQQVNTKYHGQFSPYFMLFLAAPGWSSIQLSAFTLLLADEDERSSLHRDFSTMNESKRSSMLAMMRRRLYSRTMGLLEISETGTVKFLHTTMAV